MHKARINKTAASALSRLVLGGTALVAALSCATLTRRPEDNRLFVDSKPPGATIKVNGEVMGTTPQMLTLGAERAFRIVLRKEHYKTAELRVFREGVEATAWDGPFGAVVDAATGAAWRLQRKTLFAELELAVPEPVGLPASLSLPGRATEP